MMADYSVLETARELMLEPEDLEEIYELFFTDVKSWLQDYQQLATGDAGRLAALLHSLKGAANNLRMEETARKARQLEKEVLEGLSLPKTVCELEILQKDIGELEARVHEFYARLSD